MDKKELICISAKPGTKIRIYKILNEQEKFDLLKFSSVSDFVYKAIERYLIMHEDYKANGKFTIDKPFILEKIKHD